VHRRVLMATALTTGVLAAACSRPASQSQNPSQGSAAGARQIELVKAPAGAEALTSDLEARRASRPAPRRPARPTLAAATAGEPDAALSHDHAVAAVAAVVPEVGTTASTVTEAPMSLAAAPLPAPQLPVAEVPAGGGGPSAGHDPDHQPMPGARGPQIIIRGGMGTAHDDCKIHAPGARGGLAINRIAPSFSPYGGGGSSSGGRFPRGGIR
jgi:hypothetical protein